MLNDTVTCSILKAKGPLLEWVEDIVVQEVPLTIHYNGEVITTLSCSPSHTEELVYGFLFNEGFIRVPKDVYNIRHDPSDHSVWVEGKPYISQKELMSTQLVSACRGKSRTSFNFANDALVDPALTSTYCISLQEAYDYIKFLKTNSTLFNLTGGVHSGGVANQGKVILMSHDISRHNVFDKLCGSAFQAGLNLENSVIFFSGRVSSEILLKVAKMKVPILIARGAPTNMALSQAADLNITIIGFAREQRLNIYTCPNRIIP